MSQNKEIPQRFLHWAYRQRAAMIRKMAEGEDVHQNEVFLAFTRHTPTFISHGPAGLNGSVKGVGFVPKEAYLQDTLSTYLEHIHNGWGDDYSKKGLEVLMKKMWGEGCWKRLDFRKLISIELARKHSWTNFQQNKDVTLCFYEPPAITFEVRGRVEIHTQGIYHQFANAQHDVYHKPNPSSWASRPVYLIHIQEIFDNSLGRQAFGTKIY